MQTRIQKWGNSLAVRIPKIYAEQLGLVCESQVDLEISGGILQCKPIPEERHYDLEEMLAGITEENLHRETDTGTPVGKEFW